MTEHFPTYSEITLFDKVSKEKANKTFSSYNYCAHFPRTPLETVDIQFSQHLAKYDERPQANLSQHSLTRR